MGKLNWILFFCLPYFVLSCTSSKEKPVEIPGFVSGKIYPDKKLILMPKIWQIGIDSGATVFDHTLQSSNSTVFEFTYQKSHRADIEDGESMEVFLIEIESDTDSVIIRNKQIRGYKNVYRHSCFSIDCNKGLPISSGYFIGRKLDNKSWWFEVEVGMIYFRDTIFIGKETRKEI